MRGDDDLYNAGLLPLAHEAQKRKLPCNRKSGFRLVQQQQRWPGRNYAMPKQRQKGFPVGSLMEGKTAVCCIRVLVWAGSPRCFVEVAGVIEKAFCAKEEAAHGLSIPDDVQRVRQLRVRVGRIVGGMPTAALGVQSGGKSQVFQQRRFAAAVIANEKGNRPIQDDLAFRTPG